MGYLRRDHLPLQSDCRIQGACVLVVVRMINPALMKNYRARRSLFLLLVEGASHKSRTWMHGVQAGGR
jgi:hypothetical protein